MGNVDQRSAQDRELEHMNDRLPRKLTAILYADVAGYSRLTGVDEEGTHRRLSEYLDLLAAAIQSHRGRVVHYVNQRRILTLPGIRASRSCFEKKRESAGVMIGADHYPSELRHPSISSVAYARGRGGHD